MKKTLKLGDVYAIQLQSKKYTFGVVCYGPNMAFFDCLSETPIAPTGLLDLKLIFRVPVSRDAVRSGKWTAAGNVALKDDYAKPAKYLHKPVGSEQFYIYSDGEEIPASKEECLHLEILATWFAQHVEERLENYFSGLDVDYMLAVKKQLGIL